MTTSQPARSAEDSAGDATARSGDRAGADAAPAASDDPLPRRSTRLFQPGALEVEMVDPGRLTTPDQRQWLSAHAERALRELGLTGELRIRLVGDAEMADAHQRHMDVAQTTDVITFDLAPDEPDRLDTDLLICVDEARRQSEARSIPIERELLLYALHGVLHGAGYDDGDPEAARAMHAREDEILEAIGVGATYAPLPSSEAPPR